MSKSARQLVAPQKVIASTARNPGATWSPSRTTPRTCASSRIYLRAPPTATAACRNAFPVPSRPFNLADLRPRRRRFDPPPHIAPNSRLVVLHRLAELDTRCREGYARYDFQGVFRALFEFATGDLSSFYFDIRKDALYCDGRRALRRRAAQTVLDPSLPPPDNLAPRRFSSSRWRRSGSSGSPRRDKPSVHLQGHARNARGPAATRPLVR